MNSANQKLLVSFFTAGYPQLDSTLGALDLLAPFSDYVEIGLAHSDALADGPVIQVASHQALQNGMNLSVLLEQLGSAGDFKNKKSILFTYSNPLLAYGLERALDAWAALGGLGVLVPDLPLEECAHLHALCLERNLRLIFLLAPTSSRERIERVVELSTEFIYLVSFTGVTGSGKSQDPALKEIIAQIKSLKPNLPVVIGFGIKSGTDILSALALGADGVVVGSALVEKLGRGEELSGFLRELVGALGRG